jgi:hypothetical protein
VISHERGKDRGMFTTSRRVKERGPSDLINSNMTALEIRFSDSIITTVVNYMNV